MPCHAIATVMNVKCVSKKRGCNSEMMFGLTSGLATSIVTSSKYGASAAPDARREQAAATSVQHVTCCSSPRRIAAWLGVKEKELPKPSANSTVVPNIPCITTGSKTRPSSSGDRECYSHLAEVGEPGAGPPVPDGTWDRR